MGNREMIRKDIQIYIPDVNDNIMLESFRKFNMVAGIPASWRPCIQDMVSFVGPDPNDEKGETMVKVATGMIIALQSSNSEGTVNEHERLITTVHKVTDLYQQMPPDWYPQVLKGFDSFSGRIELV